MTGDGRTHRLGIEPFAFDLAGLEDVVGEGSKAGLVAHVHADVSQAAQQEALRTRDLRQRACQRCKVVVQGGPFGRLPDAEPISAFHAEIMRAILRTGNVITAYFAENSVQISARAPLVPRRSELRIELISRKFLP